MQREPGFVAINVSVPRDQRAWVEERVAGGGYGTVSEYIRELIRRDRKEHAREEVEMKVLEGLDSGEPIPATGKLWAGLKRRIRKGQGGKRAKRA